MELKRRKKKEETSITENKIAEMKVGPERSLLPVPAPSLAEGDRSGRGAGQEVGVLQPEDPPLLCRAGHPLCRLLYEVANLPEQLFLLSKPFILLPDPFLLLPEPCSPAL